jgi:hypothetical protein
MPSNAPIKPVQCHQNKPLAIINAQLVHRYRPHAHAKLWPMEAPLASASCTMRAGKIGTAQTQRSALD